MDQKMSPTNHELADELLCGLWHVSVTEQIAGEVDTRILAAGADEMRPLRFPRDILDRVFEAVRTVFVEARAVGWRIWREDYQQPQATRRGEAQQQLRRLTQQQDIRNYEQLRSREI